MPEISNNKCCLCQKPAILYINNDDGEVIYYCADHSIFNDNTDVSEDDESELDKLSMEELEEIFKHLE